MRMSGDSLFLIMGVCFVVFGLILIMLWFWFAFPFPFRFFGSKMTKNDTNKLLFFISHQLAASELQSISTIP